MGLRKIALFKEKTGLNTSIFEAYGTTLKTLKKYRATIDFLLLIGYITK